MRTAFIVAFTALVAAVSAAPASSGSVSRRAPIPEPILAIRAPLAVFTDNETALVEPPSAGTSVAKPATEIPLDETAFATGIIETIKLVISILKGIKADIAGRKQFTQQVVADVRTKFPDQNVVISNVGFDFEGVKTHQEQVIFTASVGNDVTFEVLLFQAGTFTLQGDGGFQNWAYIIDGDCTRDLGVLVCP